MISVSTIGLIGLEYRWKRNGLSVSISMGDSKKIGTSMEEEENEDEEDEESCLVGASVFVVDVLRGWTTATRLSKPKDCIVATCFSRACDFGRGWSVSVIYMPKGSTFATHSSIDSDFECRRGLLGSSSIMLPGEEVQMEPAFSVGSYAGVFGRSITVLDDRFVAKKRYLWNGMPELIRQVDDGGPGGSLELLSGVGRLEAQRTFGVEVALAALVSRNEDLPLSGMGSMIEIGGRLSIFFRRCSEACSRHKAQWGNRSLVEDDSSRSTVLLQTLPPVEV